jgi:competence protein ComEC
MVVSEFLWERGYSRIDLILATHADIDHIQGLEDVAKNFQIGEALVTPAAIGDPQYSELFTHLTKRSVPITSVSEGMEFEIEGVRVEVLHPGAETTGTSDNNSSAVIRLTFGERRILMTGDIEKEAERQLLGRDLRADIVKVPHHGSRTSSTREFVEAVMPSEAVITAGRRSVFGHPHAEVRERWAAAGARVMQAGDAGTISALTDGTGMALGTFGVRE